MCITHVLDVRWALRLLNLYVQLYVAHLNLDYLLAVRTQELAARSRVVVVGNQSIQFHRETEAARLPRFLTEPS
jgi:acyl-coenzyme A thioesterase PaaI-like protein